jgi:hypothetical protein
MRRSLALAAAKHCPPFFALLTTLATIAIAACQRPASEPAGPLDGAWRLVAAKPVDSTGQLSAYSPGGSLFIFTPSGHYSMAWTRSPQADQPFAQRWNPTNAERIARYDALTMNAGTYSVTGKTLTIRPLIARAPEYIGGSGTYEFRTSGDTLFLTDLNIVSFDSVPVPGFAAGGRYHHTLVRLR